MFAIWRQMQARRAENAAKLVITVPWDLDKTKRVEAMLDYNPSDVFTLAILVSVPSLCFRLGSNCSGI